MIGSGVDDLLLNCQLFYSALTITPASRSNLGSYYVLQVDHPDFCLLFGLSTLDVVVWGYWWDVCLASSGGGGAGLVEYFAAVILWTVYAAHPL